MLIAYVSARPAAPDPSSFSSTSEGPPPPTQTNGQKEVQDRNIARAGNVVATLEHVQGAGNVNQKDNNEENHDRFMNSIKKGQNPLNVEAKADNTVAGLQNAKGKNTVDQGQNNNNDINNVENKISSSNANSAVYFAAGNTVGKAISVSSGTNMIQQAANNDVGKNEFTNV